ncbi:hypothetical protein [Actinomycetospora termitidis]|uniref:Excalibur calcium-binding domain-containing protein n=1 Tax=Actinomycetospora termitidis TaxID=3053470 RepID=A0ABT7MB10_9PSEU|nr:hypothetical protein [Actinomycetospora sp. Odt1-22]MDL5157850.1 hypothetical protein [Actinomycetospora sp. Odt1-22]
MRTGRGTRSAAVLMAGLVGAAVIAPGVASAQESGPSSASCAAQGEIFDADSGSCVSPQEMVAQAQARAQAAAERARARAKAAAEQAQARVQAAQEKARAAQEKAREAAAAAPVTTTTPDTATTTGASSTEATTDSSTTTTTTTTDSEQDAPATRSTVSAEDAAAALQNLTGTVRSGLPIDEALKDLPRGNLELGDVTIPDFPESGSFSSPRDACVYLASKVSVDDADADAVGTQFASFCGALPDSFDPATGYGTLPDLVAALDRLCHGLKHTKHHDWHGRDIDCGDVTADEAQATYEADRSDPNNLDGDDDGRACEWNPDDYETVAAHYEGYPQGGVATGDSQPGVPAGAVALAGLALAGVAGTTRRREREDA